MLFSEGDLHRGILDVLMTVCLSPGRWDVEIWLGYGVVQIDIRMLNIAEACKQGSGGGGGRGKRRK
jgi:hypothetical protein